MRTDPIRAVAIDMLWALAAGTVFGLIGLFGSSPRTALLEGLGFAVLWFAAHQIFDAFSRRRRGGGE